MAESRPMARVLDEALATDPGRAALVIDGRPTTYAELDEAVRRCAAGLVAQGVQAGWRIPLADDASLLSVSVLLAAARVGAAAALMNPRLTAGELAELRRAAGAAPVGVAGDGYETVLAEAGGTVLGAGDLLFAAAGTAPSPRDLDYDPGADAVVLFTSGTTGTPKAVPLTHGLVGPRVAAFSPSVDPVPVVSLMCVPLVHIGGALGLLVALARGGTVVVQTRFDAGEWLALAGTHRVNSSFVVPTMLHRILEHPDFDRTDLGSLTALSYGAAPASPDLIRRAMDRLPGVALTNTFGQTETLGSITALGPDDHTPERLASVGRPLPGVEVRVVDPATGGTVEPGSVGELWVRTEASVIPGAQAADVSVPAGWLRTGDMVSEDADGYLYPAGRLADTINRGGEKFSPAEVEAVVAAHPAVADVAVVGVPDPEMGSRVGVAVVATGPLDVDELRGFCRGRIAPFKLPERVLVVDEIPYNDFGKVDRKALRQRFAEAPR
ncbi:MAG: class I adenylate-forming enzyme family protein [Acidimicrobiales bacterium]